MFPMDVIGVAEHEPWEAEDLLEGGVHLWHGSHQRVRLEPTAPARIFRVLRWARSEHDFDYFMEPVVVPFPHTR
jgi:starch synthase (maltosyl-transferring)